MLTSGSSSVAVGGRWGATTEPRRSWPVRVRWRQPRQGCAGSPATHGPTTTRAGSTTTGSSGAPRRRHGSALRGSTEQSARRTRRSGPVDPPNRSSASAVSAAQGPARTRPTPAARSSVATDEASEPAPSTTTNRLDTPAATADVAAPVTPGPNAGPKAGARRRRGGDARPSGRGLLNGRREWARGVAQGVESSGVGPGNLAQPPRASGSSSTGMLKGRDPDGPAPSGRDAVGRDPRPRPGVSGLAEDPVEVRAAHGAHGLGHAPAVLADDDLALRLALLLALDAVELACVGLVTRHRGLSPCLPRHRWWCWTTFTLVPPEHKPTNPEHGGTLAARRSRGRESALWPSWISRSARC